MKIASGPNKGFYYLQSPLTADNSLVRDNTVYSRMKLPNNQRIHGFNSSYLPFVNGYYYVPKNDELDVRKVIYALQTKQVPSSGNTETFLRNFQDTVSVPDDYCPYILDPCNYDWCERCKTQNTPAIIEDGRGRNIYMLWCFFILTLIIVLALRS